MIDNFKGRLRNFDLGIYIATTVVVVFGCIYAIIMGLFAYGFIGEPSIPLIDSLTTAISLVANFYLAKRYIENWFLWIIVDVMYVGVFMYKELYMTAGLYLLFFFMAIQGYRKWRELYDTKTTT
jgi:nicotinamide mononucleotide transporter